MCPLWRLQQRSDSLRPPLTKRVGRLLNPAELPREEMFVTIQVSWVILCLQMGRIRGTSQEPCVHGGVKFKHGDYFLPQDPMLSRSDVPGRCVQCSCHDGLVYCEAESCPKLNCPNPVHSSKYCCPHCSEVIEQTAGEPSSLIFPPPKKKTRRKNDCTSGGRYYKDGSSWQPLMGPLGVMSCVQCGCQRGVIVCSRYQCREMPCSHPKREFGHCCPVCPEVENDIDGVVTCLPRLSEVFVYKTPKADKITQRIEYGFLHASRRSSNELHTWDTRLSGENCLQVSMIPRSEISKLNLVVIGSTSHKQWTRFVRRERHLSSRCAARCAERVLSLEETLKLYPVSERSRCRSDEVDTNLLLS